MSKLRIFLVISMVILGVLVALTVFRPMTSGEKYSTVSRESIIRQEDRWIIQFDLINCEGKEQNYTICVLVNDGKPYKEDVLLRHDRRFRFIRRIPSHELSGEKGKVAFAIYKEGEDTPFEQATYHLK